LSIVKGALYRMGFGQDGQGINSRQGQDTYLYFTASEPALGPTQSLIQRVPGALSPGVRRPGRGATEVKNDGAVPPLFYACSWRVAVHTDYSLLGSDVV
jgi:hypothetical protein